MEKFAELIDQVDIFAILCEAKAKVFGPYLNGGKEGRKFVIVIDEKGKRRSVSWPKYLVEQHLGRELGIDETIDHWDTDINNNDFSNLRIVPRSQHSADDTRRVKMLDLECAMCKKHFERSPRLVRDKSKKGKVSQFCSRQCAGKYSRDVQLGKRDKLPVQEPPKSEYFKRKYQIQSEINIDHLISKYGDRNF